VGDEESLHAAAILQSGLVDVQVHPVDRLDLEDHMIRQDVGDSAG